MGLIQNGIGDASAEVRAAGHLDLMLQTGLDEYGQQVLILEDRASGEDGAGDLDVVERQNIDEGGRRPGGRRQTLGQGFADVVLGLTGEDEEDVGQDGGQVLAGGRVLVAQGHDAHQQSLPVLKGPAVGEGQQVRHGRAGWLKGACVFQGDCRHDRQLPTPQADDRLDTMSGRLSGQGGEDRVNHILPSAAVSRCGLTEWPSGASFASGLRRDVYG